MLYQLENILELTDHSFFSQWLARPQSVLPLVGPLVQGILPLLAGDYLGMRKGRLNVMSSLKSVLVTMRQHRRLGITLHVKKLSRIKHHLNRCII